MKAILRDNTTIENAVFDEVGTITQKDLTCFSIPKEEIRLVQFANIEEFDKLFKPVTNPFSFPEESFNFETYGAELDFVLKADPRTVWTIADGDDGNLWVSQGYHLVNRVHYMISEIPALWTVADILYCDELSQRVCDCYENGECPDCSETIDAEAEDGSECHNCGHVFHVNAEYSAEQNNELYDSIVAAGKLEWVLEEIHGWHDDCELGRDGECDIHDAINKGVEDKKLIEIAYGTDADLFDRFELN